LDLLLDTHVLVWTATGDHRLSSAVREAIVGPSSRLFVSAVIAYEFTDLNLRGRFGTDLPLGPILAELSADVLPFPAAAWTMLSAMPLIHRDPVDRMLVAHALTGGYRVASSDEAIRRYPVDCIS
jgi:PIN domain nuclease of toxin-antitoxin system